PHPAHQTGRPFSGTRLSGKALLHLLLHTFAHERSPLRSLELVKSQLLVQVLVWELVPAISRHLELHAQPLTDPIADVAVDVPVGLAHRPDAQVVGPASYLAVDPPNLHLDGSPSLLSSRQLTNLTAEPLDLLPRRTRSYVG